MIVNGHGKLVSFLLVQQECSRRFPVYIPGVDSMVKADKFTLCSMNSSMNDQIRVQCTLCGDNIAHAVSAHLMVVVFLFNYVCH